MIGKGGGGNPGPAKRLNKTSIKSYTKIEDR